MELERSESQRRQRRRPPRSKRRASRAMNSISDEQEMDIADEQFVQEADVKMEAEADVKMEAEAEKMVAAFMSDSEEEATMDEESIRAILQTQGPRRKPPRLLRRSSKDSEPWPRVLWCKRMKFDPEEMRLAHDHFLKMLQEGGFEYIKSLGTASTAASTATATAI